MKKIISLLLTAALLASLCAVFAVNAFAAGAIAIDGKLDDEAWLSDGWQSVYGADGYWQAIPTTSESISYKYQFRADETKLYVAVEIDCDVVEGGNGAGTNVRFWLNTNENATVYTHFYDVYYASGAVATLSKYNTSETSNSSAVISDSSIKAALVSASGKTYVEFSIDLAEFNGEDGFNYYICCSNKVTENVCLYYPTVAEGETRAANLPYSKWYRENEGDVAIEDIIIVSGGDTSDDVTSDEVVYPEWSAFWITHFNDGFVEGAGSVFTAEDTAGGWWIHVAFAPVEGYTNVFEVASISNGLSYGDGAVQAIPEGGFVWAANYGNNYPALGLGEIDYTSAGCSAAIDTAATWTVGQQFVFDGLDLEGLTVPTSTPETAWYDDAYVCTAKIKDFVEGDPDAKLVGAEDDTTDESEKTEDAGDATSMLVFAVIALVAIAGSAVVIKTRK